MSAAFTLNGTEVRHDAPPAMRLSKVLRQTFALTGTKVGCDAGDCGACTVLLDGAPVCACLVAAGKVDGRAVTTIEGLDDDPHSIALRASFLRHGAIQCGVCTPGMLVAATDLLRRNPAPSEAEATDALGGVLCRCTGYRKLVRAVMDAGNGAGAAEPPEPGAAVGARIERLDGAAKANGREVFGADAAPEGALLVRLVRGPHHRASFTLGDLDAYRRRHPGVVRVLSAADVPGVNRFGVIPAFADQPVFAVGETRYRGEPVAAVVGERDAIEALDLGEFPVAWTPLPHVLDVDGALEVGAHDVCPGRDGNILVRGHVARGDLETGFGAASAVVEGTFTTGFVEHAYIEPEAASALRVGDMIEVRTATQAPYMNRAELAAILGLAPEAVRIVPTAVGGGFGAKLDLSVQPYVALAAWRTGQPARMVYSRRESIMATTKRHPAAIRAQIGADADGRLVAMDFEADFNTGAYASWGPTVANRVPVHASGPYLIPHYRARTQAVHTNCVPAGAFRGFGVPQAGVAQEQLFDELADRLNLDRLEFRILNALDGTTPTVTGQILGEGVGIKDCLEALRPHWARARDAASAFNAEGAGPRRRGVGVAGMWYGCGNTALPNPSTILVGLRPDGRVALHQGAVDIGQGANTVIAQICADALGAPIGRFERVGADTGLTPDAGKTSASRQTFVSGKAAELAGRALRRELLRLANAGEGARLTFADGLVRVAEGDHARTLRLDELPLDGRGYVLTGEATFDPPTTALDADGQGDPYAVYGFGAHMAEVEVDADLGTVKVLKITAAHDVGRAINPTLVEGQIEGGVAQGLGLALMEEFVPGRGENLHDYLIPTAGDVPPIESILIEAPTPLGPFGAKGIGEQALIPTAPAILNAVFDATGARLRRVPATPDRVRAAILAVRGAT